jgi:hypothetical protein
MRVSALAVGIDFHFGFSQYRCGDVSPDDAPTRRIRIIYGLSW